MTDITHCRKWLFVAVIAAFCFSGCAAVPFFSDRGITARDIAFENGFSKVIIRGHDFALVSFIRIEKEGEPLVIYIEGDGLAWKSRSRVSSDPTPTDDLVMRLAALDPSSNVAYLARPGQYNSLGASRCDMKYWTGSRFSEEVIEDMNMAVSRLRETAHAPSVSLVGYSGGGAVAVLAAARRTDVTSLRTIAGNLDHEAVNKFNGVSRLNNSLNPIDFADEVKKIPQRHFIGSRDKIIPISAVRSFAAAMGDKGCLTVTVADGVGHAESWYERWPKLLNIPPVNSDN